MFADRPGKVATSLCGDSCTDHPREARPLAISPPSDIVLDVARAAEPTAVEAARAELLRRAHGPADVPFDVEARPLQVASAPGLSRTTSQDSLPDASRKFEAMILQTFISSMMPKNAEGTYGQGIAGDMWKSMMAEKIAGVVAERGGIGIADRIFGDFHMQGETKIPVAGVTPHADLSVGAPSAVATALVDQIERQLAREIGTQAAYGAGLFKK